MGCCESRAKSLETKPVEIPEKNLSLIQQARQLNIQHYKSDADRKVVEILEHFFDLEKEDKWTTVLTDENFSAKKIDFSKFSKDFVVTRVCMNFDVLVPLKLILEIILARDIRVKWDNYIDSLEILEGHSLASIIYKKLKILFYSAEFIDKQVVVMGHDSVYIVSYSIDEDVSPRDKSCVRAKNIMAVFCIREYNESTEILVVNQTDPKSKAHFLASSLGLVKQKAWIQQFKKQVLKRL